MRKHLTIVCFMLMFSGVFAQKKNNVWTVSTTQESGITSRVRTSESKIFDLDLDALKSNLQQVQSRGATTSRTQHMISFPTADGTIQSFRVVEASVLHPDLAAKYPGIKSYAGQSVDDPTATIRFSLTDQKGFHGMILSGTTGMSYIDPFTEDGKTYKVYARSSIENISKEFECMVEDFAADASTGNTGARATDDKKLRKYRLALACTAEYGNLFAGSGTDAQKKANILAQMNVTMTRVNGVYERDLAITMEIVPNNDAVIYHGATNSDPWTNEYNSKTQQTIDANIGDANYDIGHLFVAAGDNGNAGCIGCVCTSGSKGSAFTSRGNPTGDPFDIDFVAHEMGHQFGGYHTMNTCSRSGSGSTEVEPASGSSIMGYAGICSSNVQNNSDAHFAYVNIRDISANVQTGTSSTCAQVVNLSNNAPTANAGPNYSIPKSTPFVLRGQGSDPDGDALTYTWAQNDPERAPGNGSPSSTWTVGPMFRARLGTSSPDRYMPQISDVVAGNLTPTWEVVPSVARSMEFSLVVRDNKAGGGQTADDLMSVNVVDVTPFTMSAPNSNVTWNVGQTQTVTWNVGSTNSSPINCANVNILLSTDGGFTYPITLLSNTANDGSANVTVPNNVSSTCRIMVAAADNIFYDISNTNFSIEGAVTCNATVPTGLAASNVGSSTADLNWTAVPGASYDVRYRATGTSTWTTVSNGGNSYGISGLSPLTEYEAQVRSVCPSTNSAYSSSVTFTTTEVQLNYCASNGNNVSDEYIGRVQLGSIDNSTGAGAGGYADHTSISTALEVNSSNTITVTPTWTGTIYSEGYAVWIDYNKDGDFGDAGELVWSLAATQNTPVAGSFTVPASATIGNTRMRVSMKYNGIPTSCESFSYGEVEDYTVNITPAGEDTDPPTVPTGLAASNITETSMDLSWNASSDTGSGVAGYDIYVGATLNGSSSTNSYTLTGLTVATSYSITVAAKDVAGNVSAQSSALNATTVDLTAPSAPTGLATSNTTQTTTDLSWTASTDNVGVTGYDVLIDGVVDGSTTSTNYAITGLSASTTYALAVRAKDAAGNTSTNGTTIVTTLDPVGGGCTGGISSFPYSEGFESGLGAWTQDTSDDINWTVDSNGTPSSSTGPSSATEGSNYLYIESSGNGTGYPNKVAIINSPCIDLTGETAATFTFSYHMYGSSMGSLNLQASTDGNNWTSLWSLSGNQGNAWSSANIDLSSYAGGTVELRYVGTTSTSYRSDMAIDKLSLTTGIVTCTDVTLTLIVDNYPEETSWSITDGGGSTVASGAYTNSTPDGSTVIETACLPDGCYTFTINDSYGDGICCSYGNGSYALEDEGGTLLASGGSFGSSEATNFCIGGSSRGQTVDRFVPTYEPTAYPNPVSEVLYLNPPADFIYAEVMTVSGLVISDVPMLNNGVDVSGLKNGVYFVLIHTEKATLTSRFIKN